jgi:hypothetical protein
MRKLFLMIAFLSVISGSTMVSAQDYSPTDYLYTSTTFSAFLKFDINDQLQAIYFATGEKWLEYDLVDASYIGEGKGWVYKIKDGMGNNYTVKRPTLEGNITVSPVKGKILTLVRKKI